MPPRTRSTRPAKASTAAPADRTAARLDLATLLTDRETRIVVCCGAGGVGKTTTAAALGLWAAEHGRRVVVLTIDPARRLAQSLGLTELDNTPRPVAGVGTGSGGSLDAMMLDMKRTFDEVVEQHATPDKAAQIL
ncbi:MAG: ArsA-related P-loop ATPase, partial [Thermoleophilaceae bacterium]